MKIRLSHPGVPPFAQQAARAYFEAGLLDSFSTSFVYRPEQLSGKSLRRLAGLFVKNAESEFGRRRVSQIPDSFVRSYAWRECVRIGSDRLAGPATRDAVWEWAELAFDRQVARHLIPELRAVHGYEYASLATFEKARRLGIGVIYDMPVPSWQRTREILEGEYRRYPELRSPQLRQIEANAERRNQRKQRELDLADIVVTNSEFSRQSLLDAGVESERLLLAPYGMPPPLEEPPAVARRKFRFLYAGTLSVRKGVHYLLDAWRTLAPSPERAELFLLGALDLPASLLRDLPGSVQYHRSVPREQLFESYQQATLLLFPTLCDGFGQVLTEALSQALPVLTTSRAGASQFIEAGRNGFIVDAGSSEALAEQMSWCLSNAADVEAMRSRCLQTAASWQWSDYRKRLRNEIEERFKGTRLW